MVHRLQPQDQRYATQVCRQVVDSVQLDRARVLALLLAAVSRRAASTGHVTICASVATSDPSFLDRDGSATRDP